jgi:hypothetical protein
MYHGLSECQYVLNEQDYHSPEELKLLSSYLGSYNIPIYRDYMDSFAHEVFK